MRRSPLNSLARSEMTVIVTVSMTVSLRQFVRDPRHAEAAHCGEEVLVTRPQVLGLTLITADAGIRDAASCAVEFYPFKPSRQKRRG